MTIPEDRPFSAADAVALSQWQSMPVQARPSLTLEWLEFQVRLVRHFGWRR